MVLLIQKQSPKVFFKKGALKVFTKIHKKTPVPESLFKQSYRPQACNFIKKRNSGTGVLL